MMALGLVASGWLIAVASAQPKEEEQERTVKESEVPPAALAALKKLAGGAAISQYEEEIEHGTKFYEGSWKGPGGRMEVLVTAAGDLVETEEAVQADAVPKAVLDAAHKEAGKDAKMFFEKKTYVMYEVKFKKGEKRHEILLAPDGRQHEHEESSKSEEDDEPR